ncbi:Helix-turn-helix domain-containing protein [Oscillibacter sp. PC13]|nr:helix-turn-helix domain-containing protein [Oscillibacter sp. PC13]SFP70412.1 Helix-turn-helix domain-containing protein [Oscillibacter sp. PC13]
MASVGKHIRRLRSTCGMTQEALAEKLFVTRQAVSAWETGLSLS